VLFSFPVLRPKNQKNKARAAPYFSKRFFESKKKRQLMLAF
jgi:hypothetical protein